MCKKGFTLIELLVVVLIIGILAVIAMPRYTRIIEKARSREAISMLKAVKDSLGRYYTTHGTYTNRLEDLDVSVPENKNWQFDIAPDLSVYAIRKISSQNYLIAYRFDTRTDVPQMICRSETSADYGEEVCKNALGATTYNGSFPFQNWVLDAR